MNDKKAWECSVVGVNRGDGKTKLLSGSLLEVLEEVYVASDTHDTVHLGTVEVNKIEFDLNECRKSDKIVCVKLSGVTEEEVKNVLTELAIPNLNVILDGVTIKL